MTMLCLGVLLFALVHFVPSLAPTLKTNWQQRAGENGYKGVFSLLLLASFGLMIFGWRSAHPSFVYAPPAALHIPALIVMAIGFVLFAVSNRPSRLRLFVRHPQLTGLAFWSAAHLMLNGDSRSAILFGGLLLWACIEIVAINRREGAWVKEPPPAWASEAISLVIAAVTVGVLVFIHPWLSGVDIT
jgi:uncharacterized membrane protein